MNEGMYINNSSLYISIRNLDEFKLLIDDVQEQLDNLAETIKKIRNYELDIHFETKKET